MVGTDRHEGESTASRVDASSRLSVIMAGICVLLLSALIVPAVMHTRMAARRNESANQLKNLALGLHNYQHSHRALPPGASLSAEGDEMHGWFTLLLPYLDASQLPSRIEKTLPWDHALNAPFFHVSFPVARVPGNADLVTTEGFGTLHYLANPRCMYRGSRVDVEQSAVGRAHVWVLGEALRPRAPWGYPFNWRALVSPIGREGGYGADWNGAQFAMGDGRVAYYSADTDPKILAQLRSTLPAPRNDLVACPERSFGGGTESIHSLDLNPTAEDGVMFRVSRYSGGQSLTAIHFYKSKRPALPVTREHVSELYDHYPGLTGLFVRGRFEDADIGAVTRFRRLKVLSVGFLDISANGVKNLASLPALEVLRATCSPAVQAKLQKALPRCDLHLTLTDAPPQTRSDE